MPIALLSINIAASDALDASGVLHGIGFRKRPVAGSVDVRLHGLVGLELGDDRPQPPDSGISRAIFAYPSEHFAFWRTVRAQAKVAGWDDPIPPGMLGEGLTLGGLVESQAWVGDRLRFADCELAVSEPGIASDELNASLEFRHAAKMMAANGWCGFYLSVIQPGRLRAGEKAELIPGPREVGIAELFRSRVAAQRR